MGDIDTLFRLFSASISDRAAPTVIPRRQVYAKKEFPCWMYVRRMNDLHYIPFSKDLAVSAVSRGVFKFFFWLSIYAQNGHLLMIPVCNFFSKNMISSSSAMRLRSIIQLSSIYRIERMSPWKSGILVRLSRRLANFALFFFWVFCLLEREF